FDDGTIRITSLPVVPPTYNACFAGLSGSASRVAVTICCVTVAVAPEYVAAIEWLPRARAVVVNDATPPVSVTVPRTVVPSLNVTDPVVPPVTVAVNVTGWPGTATGAELASVTDTVAAVMTRLAPT